MMLPSMPLPERYRDRMLRPAGAVTPAVIVTVRPAAPAGGDDAGQVPVKPPFYLTRSGDA